MRFVRQRINPLAREQLRTIGARSGWLIETADTIRCAFGDSVIRVSLDGGLAPRTDALAQLRSHELTGDAGPSGTGIVAFGSLPFDRDAPGQLDVARYTITQRRNGDTWLTSLEGSNSWLELVLDEAPPTQETQSIRSLTYQPTPEEYAHNVALAGRARHGTRSV